MDTPDSRQPRFKKWIGWFLFVVAVPVIGLLQPFWSPWAELTSHSLSARVTSSVALQPAETLAIPDMVVSVAGRTLASPYLSTVVLTNNGAKPIAASDFESPIELATGKDVEVVRATVSAINPPDLQGIIIMDKQAVKLKPMLLNPGDSLQFAIITTGKSPVFTPRARIAGVSKLSLENGTKPKISSRQGLLSLAFFAIALIMYPLCTLGVIQPRAVPSVRWLAFGGAVVSLGLSSLTGSRVFDWMGIDTDGATLAAVVTMLIFGILVYRTPAAVLRA